MTYPGLFIALEGGDGAGKTTQRTLLGEWIESLGAEVVLTREPGGTPLGQVLRDALLHGGHVDPRTEALLFATDRSHHVATVVRPALERGAVVVTDRYVESSMAYQGAARNLGREDVLNLSMWGTYDLLPDLTILMDLDPEVAAIRREGEKPDRLERESLAFHQAVRATFLDLAAENPDRHLVVDASDDPQSIAARIREAVTGRLDAKNLMSGR